MAEGAVDTLSEAMDIEAQGERAALELENAGKGIKDGEQENVRPPVETKAEPEPAKAEAKPEPEVKPDAKDERKPTKTANEARLERLLAKQRAENNRLLASLGKPGPGKPAAASRQTIGMAEILRLAQTDPDGAAKLLEERDAQLRAEIDGTVSSRFAGVDAKAWLLSQPEAKNEGFEDDMMELMEAHPEIDEAMAPKRAAEVYYNLYLGIQAKKAREEKAKEPPKDPSAPPPPPPGVPAADLTMKRALTPNNGAAGAGAFDPSRDLDEEQFKNLSLANKEMYLKAHGDI